MNTKIVKFKNYKNSYINSFESLIRGKNIPINFFLHESQFDAEKMEADNTYDWYIKGFNDGVKLWEKHIKENSIVLDIGANDGDSSLIMGALAGEHGRVLAFEPGIMFEALEINKKINPHLNIEIFNFGLAEEDKEYSFCYQDKNQSREVGNGGIITSEMKIGSWDFNVTKRIKCFNLMGVLINKNIDVSKISFIKTDTEGYDIKILNTIPDIIINNRPIFFIEWWPNTDAQIFKFIKDYNYLAIDPQTMSTPINWVQDLLLLPK